MLEHRKERERAKQRPLAQLTWVVASALGGKSELGDWFTGIAREPRRLFGLNSEDAMTQTVLLGVMLRIFDQEDFDALSL